MPIDVARVRGTRLPDTVGEWDADDVILYHLGVGAGVPPTDRHELAYVYEGRLQVLPTFAVVPAFGSLAAMLGVDGMAINPMLVLHGEQTVTLHRPLPTAARTVTRARITDVIDKGKGAAIILDTETRLDGSDAAGDGEGEGDGDGPLLATNRFLAFARGEGGFGGGGGERGTPPANAAPERDPDLVVESPTLPQQAALYRLSGDKNPLHIDPDLAALGGFDRPILHGLCTYGIVAKAVVDHALNGDGAAVASYTARFAGVLFPGETIVTSMWRSPSGVLVKAVCKERGTPVITNAAVTVRGE
jgi:acyl dehydratase